MHFDRAVAALYFMQTCLSSTMALSAAPVNDNFADRIGLSGSPVAAVGTTLDGTIEEGEPPVFHILSTVWYEWVAPVDGQVRVRLEDTLYFTICHVYSGSQIDDLQFSEIASSNYEGNFDVQQGMRYQFQIGPDQPVPYPRYDGPFTLRLEYNRPPPNDDYTNRIRLTNRVERISFRNVLASLEPGESLLSPGGGYSVWYEWQAPASGAVHLLVDNSYMTAAGVYKNTENGLTSITNSQFGAGNCWEEITFSAVGGEFYQVSFDNCGGQPGDHAATLSLDGAARLDRLASWPDGTAEIQAFGERFRTYVLERSTNLANWAGLSTNLYYNNPLTLTDPEAAVLPQRFYRLRLEP